MTDTIDRLHEPPAPDESGGRTVAQIIARHGSISRARKRAARVRRKLERRIHRAADSLHRALAVQRTRSAEESDVEASWRCVADTTRSDATLPEDYEEPWLSRLVNLVLAGGAAIGLWVIDNALLLVLRLPLHQTRMLTLMVVLAGALTAYFTGVTAKRRAAADYLDLQIGLFERGIGFTLPVIGLGIELGLAVMRAVVTRGGLSSALLGAAGVGVWAAIAVGAFFSHDGRAIRRARRHRALRRARVRANRATADVAIRRRELEAARHAMSAALSEHVAHIDTLIAGAVAIHRARRPNVAIDLSTTLSWIGDLRAIADGDFPECCTWVEVP